MQQELDVSARRILQMNLAVSCYTQYLRNFFIILPVRGKYQQNIEIQITSLLTHLKPAKAQCKSCIVFQLEDNYTSLKLNLETEVQTML